MGARSRNAKPSRDALCLAFTRIMPQGRGPSYPAFHAPTRPCSSLLRRNGDTREPDSAFCHVEWVDPAAPKSVVIHARDSAMCPITLDGLDVETTLWRDVHDLILDQHWLSGACLCVLGPC